MRDPAVDDPGVLLAGQAKVAKHVRPEKRENVLVSLVKITYIN